MSTYPVIDISKETPQADEQMGTKEKFWVQWDRRQWLFKYNRKNYGEDWAEKIAGEVAGLLRIPSAHSDLAVFEDEYGILVESFTHGHKEGEPGPRKVAELVHGNDLIALLVAPDYPRGLRMKNREHTLDRVESVLRRFTVTPLQRATSELGSEVLDAFDLFLSFLMLDALIANTDRHHQNWGIRVPFDGDQIPHLAPSFDHASSLGRNLTNEQRTLRLASTDAPFRPEAYAIKAPTRIYRTTDDPRPFSTMEVLAAALQRSPVAGAFWIGRLRSISREALASIIERVPMERMGTAAKEFSLSMLLAARQHLLEGANGP